MKTRRRTGRTLHLAASGGGHLDLLTWLDGALEGWDCVWVVPPTPRAAALKESGASVREIPDYGRSVTKFASNLLTSIRTIVKERPRVVVTSGAGSVVAFALLARMLGAKVIFIETMARVRNPSASGRVLSRIASSVLVQWPEMKFVYPGSVVCRPALCEEVAPSDNSGEGVFVAVGTHGDPFDRLLRMVDDAIGAGLMTGPVVAQAGVSTYRPRNYRTLPYLSPTAIEAATERARYVVCHAGSGLISSALRAGRRPLVVPRLRRHGEHFDDHQVQITERLADMGLVVPLDDAITAEKLRESEHALPYQAVMSELPSVEEALAEALARG